ncbi:trypsin-like peptidase domain-containing protein [Streptomyces tubbatahanensis]|uniref:Trypsin-like peptidase domain-containing protein n=1 Tax=Streptomyces tubbatahanensis TaxID=2923272 RepID=A0ABY3XWD7_9ACTN|nr:trypsin-like peptidase domain-containing protein [Streptomyces tubbatahanensis]UNS98801.1 trypsin-like peptidase domain-containing protein [Streptomyces tubbatahanensis]
MDEPKATRQPPTWCNRSRRPDAGQQATGAGTPSPAEPPRGAAESSPSAGPPRGPVEPWPSDESSRAAEPSPSAGPPRGASESSPSVELSHAAEPPPSAVPSRADESSRERTGSEGQAPSAPDSSGRGAAATLPGPGPELPAARTEPELPAARPQPLHGVDPYATPPYGGPGPWAPAPPVQRPAASTPPQGVPVPPAGTTPPHGVHVPPVATTPPQGVPVPPPATTPPHGVHVPPTGPTPPHGVHFPPPATPPPHGGPSGGGGLPESGSLATGTGTATGRATAVLPLPSPPAGTPPRRAPRRRSRLAVGALVLTLVAGGAGGLIGAYVERNGGVGDVELPQTAAGAGGAGGERPEGSIAGIARQTLPGVVTLHARGGGAEATGTGFVLDRRGHILTNDHVVASAHGGDSVRVTFNSGQTATGQVVGGDSGYDLAVVKVSGVSGLSPLPLGNSDAVRVGDPVVAVGAPYDLDGTVTTGIISAKERAITAGGEDPGDEMSYVNALQTDAPMNPGNSGGPLVDRRGRVIGVNSAIKGAGGDAALPEGEGGGSVGLGFAIPVNQVRRVAEELINEGRATHPVIGVTLDMEYGGEGARIGGPGGRGPAVVRGGPADSAGLREGDVITEVGGTAVAGGEELIVRVRSHRPGDKLELKVRPGGAGEERTVTVTLGSATG